MHRRYSLVPAAIAALCAAFVVAPARADTSVQTVSWDFASGLMVTPGTRTEVATLTVDEAVGICTVEMSATSGQSANPGNNLILEYNGVKVATLFGVEDEPFSTNGVSFTFDTSAGDVFDVFLESTESPLTNVAGTLEVACTTQTTTTTETTTAPDSTTTTGPPVTTTTDPDVPPTGSTPPAPGSHQEPGGELSALFGLLGILGLVGSTLLFRRTRAGS